MKILLLLFTGGGLGTLSRYFLSQLVNKMVTGNFPYGTFLVNSIGCFLIGFLVFSIDKSSTNPIMWKFLLVTGFCGGFTTFSTFSFENINLINNHQLFTSLLYTFGSIGIGLIATYAGIVLAKNI